jgi:hypothetical protein
MVNIQNQSSELNKFWLSHLEKIESHLRPKSNMEYLISYLMKYVHVVSDTYPIFNGKFGLACFLVWVFN